MQDNLANKEENTKEDDRLVQTNKNAYYDLILAQDDTVCFKIVEKLATKELPNGCALRAWERLNKKFQSMTGAFKKILCKKIAKSELYDVTRDAEDWISELELLRGDLRKLGVIIDDAKMMTRILSNLPEEYKNIIENPKDELEEDIDTLTIERIQDKISAKYNRINELSN